MKNFMLNYIVTVLALASLIVTIIPSAAQAQTDPQISNDATLAQLSKIIEDLKAKIADLLAQVDQQRNSSLSYLANFNLTDVYSIGKTAPEIKDIQRCLIKLGNLKGLQESETTQYFGRLTQAAVVSFQKANNISPTSGIIGPLTRNQLKFSCLSFVDPALLHHSLFH